MTIGAVIPIAQYANLQPQLELSNTELKEGTEFGMNWIKELYQKYSEKGLPLNEKEIIISGIKKKSFNEEGIEVGFEPIAHTYEHNGTPLENATTFIKRYYKPFDSETLAEVSAKAWGVDADEVASLWKDNAHLAATFGTVVHNALELYNNYHAMGQKISNKKELEVNYALPKHPILKGIIEGLIAIDKREGKVYSEAMVTDVKGGFCGTADSIEVIDAKKKICRVGDFKVNINSAEIDKNSKVLAPFNDLPANKLSKYQLQLSFYANMLEKSGWVVQGLDVYVYEDGWKYYELPVLKVLS